MAMIAEPRRLNPDLRLGIAAPERIAGRRMEPARLLAWYPRAALGSGVLVDMDSFEADAAGVADAELLAFQQGDEAELATLTPRDGRRSLMPEPSLRRRSASMTASEPNPTVSSPNGRSSSSRPLQPR